MGSGASHVIFDYQYQNERKLLRQNLMLQFQIDPTNQDLLSKIKMVRGVITQHAHICATAARELELDGDTDPTNKQAAFNELDRLLTIYETSTILKSVQCRIGPVACPIGHFAAYYDSFDAFKEGKKSPKCNICDKVVTDGYHCGYCMYNLCVPCSGVYCDYGHTMKLWTHPESDLECFICKAFPIHSGYRCVQCDIDFCDYCTWKDGRKVITNMILARMQKDLEYIENHVDESETALRTIETHRKKVAGAEDSYPTIKHLYDFAVSLHDIKEICVEEVRQTRITRAILKYRAILSIGKEYSKIAMEESLKTENYTQEEKERLEALLERHEYLRSVDHRGKCIVSCPLAHGMFPFEGVPEVYQERVSKKKQKQIDNGTRVNKSHRPDLLCRICRRNASPGYNCAYCEYDVCNTCAVIFCAEGHPMTMWTEPNAVGEHCFLCQKQPLLYGYRCSKCSVDLCDTCTTKEGRERIRTNWETEMNQLLQFMQINRRFSDIALFYEWRHANQIVSVGLLVDYVKELRMAKRSASKQIEQKPIIDKIKILRSEVIKHPDLCATAAREATKSDIYVFKNKEKALEEMKRLTDVLKSYIYAQSMERRAECGIACPLAHGMIPIEPDEILETESEGDFNPFVLGANYLDAKESIDELPAKSKEGTKDQLSSKNTDNGESDIEHEKKRAKMRAIVSEFSENDEVDVDDSESKTDNNSSVAEEKVGKKNNNPPNSSNAIEKSKSISSLEEKGGGTMNPMLSKNTPGSLSQRQLVIHNNPLTSQQNALPSPSKKDQMLSPGASFSFNSSQKQLISMKASSQRSLKQQQSFHPFAMKKRSCRICATTELLGGHTCTICEYDLCYECSTVYCRVGHPLKIWTMPEAKSLSCELCKSSPIISGYRCVPCHIDICDMCTTRDSRNAFMLWPRRELHRLLEYLETVKDQSSVAKLYLKHFYHITDEDEERERLHAIEEEKKKNQPQKWQLGKKEEERVLTEKEKEKLRITENLKEYMSSMSKLCRKLQEAMEVKRQVEEEIMATFPNPN